MTNQAVTFHIYTLIFQHPEMLSDLHEETCQQGFFYVPGVVPGPKGGHWDGQLDPFQSVDELGVKSVGCQQSSLIQAEVLTPLLHITI